MSDRKSYRLYQAVCGWMSRLVADRRGNVATIFALMLVPLLGCVGAAVDYSIAINRRTKIVSALDAAVLMAVSATELNNSASVVQAGALKMFHAQMSLEKFKVASVNITVTDGSSGRSAKGSVSGVVQTNFMRVMGFPTIKIDGTATATTEMPPYIDFYMLLDNTPSMGVAATPADVTTMVSNTPDQCAFACHDLSTSDNYYKLAKKLGVTMRIDVVRQATQKLTDTASATAKVTNQFRMAVYTFGASCQGAGLSAVKTLSSSLSSVKSAAENIDLMATPYHTYNGDQCTDFDNALKAIDTEIPTPGSGTSASPQKFLFLVSDGVADANYASTCAKATAPGGRCMEPLNVSACTAMKARGVKIAVLYTTYLDLPTNNWYNSWIAPFNPGPYGPSINSEIAKSMKACASDGFYFEVSPTQGISDAMTALFQKAVALSRLTK